jgi:hypothetical protein
MVNYATMETFTLPVLHSTAWACPRPFGPGNLPGEGSSGGVEKRASAVAGELSHTRVGIVKRGRGAVFLQIFVTATFS